MKPTISTKLLFYRIILIRPPKNLNCFWIAKFLGVGAPNGSLCPGRRKPSLRLWFLAVSNISYPMFKFLHMEQNRLWVRFLAVSNISYPLFIEPTNTYIADQGCQTEMEKNIEVDWWVLCASANIFFKGTSRWFGEDHLRSIFIDTEYNDKYRKYIANIFYMHRILSWKCWLKPETRGATVAGSENITQYFWKLFKNTNEQY